MTEWNIQSRARACMACERAFIDKEIYHTLLFLERADLARQDICQECWEKQYSDGARERKGFVSYWHGVFEAPAPPTEAIKKENAESLLRKIIELNDPRYVPAAFILAVMLERKRLLKVKEQIERDGQRLFVYEQPKTGDVFTIVDPGPQLNLEAVQRDVADLLEHGLNPPVQATESAGEPGVATSESAAGSAAQGSDATAAVSESPETQAGPEPRP